MAKQGQHNGDARDSDVSRGPNNPKKSTPITTGTPKKHATYAREAREHKDTDPQAQDAPNTWHNETPRGRQRRMPRSDHSGSDSNEDSGTRGH
jgi:hypothetical protein